MKLKFNDRGFIFIEVIFLALILSFTALLIFNKFETAIISNRSSVIRIAAINLANAKMSEIEEYNFKRTSFQLPSETFLTDTDLNHKNRFGINGDINFTINTEVNTLSDNHANITVKVTWSVNGNTNYGTKNGNNYEEITKDIWITKMD